MTFVFCAISLAERIRYQFEFISFARLKSCCLCADCAIEVEGKGNLTHRAGLLFLIPERNGVMR